MNYTVISKQFFYTGSVSASSGEHGTAQSSSCLVKNSGYWETSHRKEAVPEYAVIDFGKEIAADYAELEISPSGKYFPKGFAIEVSSDSSSWTVVHREKDCEPESKVWQLLFPLAVFRYMKLVINDPGASENGYFSQVGSLRTGISGAQKCWTGQDGASAAGLLEGKGWSSVTEFLPSEHVIFADMGQTFMISRMILSSGDDGFPENFHIEVSTDSDLWTSLIDVQGFRAQPGESYYWDTALVSARYIRLAARTPQLKNGQYGLYLAGMDICADICVPGKDKAMPSASVFVPGIVKLARDGENEAGAAVQGNDSRLGDASTVFKGITRFAADGDSSEGLAVQASDPRLKPATELKPGIVILAGDNGTGKGTAVQGNDSRLKEAETGTPGIVRLCEDGASSSRAVVTGNDSRLKKATVGSFGIVRLAEDGENSSGAAVQGNDRRLRDASVSVKGIVRLALDGENAEGAAVQGNDKRLMDATTLSKGIVELAEDGEVKAGAAVQGNDRRLRNATESDRGIVRLAADGEDKADAAVQGNDRRLKDATESDRGIVRLARNGEDSAGVAVQGNDRRLLDGTEVRMGIVRFAKDGETESGTAVQGSDKRLKDASVYSKGIVRLAADGEDKADAAVQGNDRRLRKATEADPGIVRFACDGEDKAGAAVQGNDSRLKKATEQTPGIMRFASDGEVLGNTAVQGNDRRLKDATVSAKGIVELADDGETTPGTAVQGNDRRLKDATVFAKGIVELADDGETTPGTAVQGNDRRLKMADHDNPGIVRLAGEGETRPGFVVQASDPRLSDAREALPHEHPYAPEKHSFNSHFGDISVTEAKNEVFREVTPPSSDSAVIYGRNTSPENGSIGLAGISGDQKYPSASSYGVVGHSTHVGVRGQAAGDSGSGSGCGVMGISRFGAGGVFVSEHGFSVVADGYGDVERYDDSVRLKGEGNALLVNGRSFFKGTLSFESEKTAVPGGITELFAADDAEFIAEGDLLTVSPAGKSVLSRSRKAYDSSVIGIVSGNPLAVFNNTGKSEKLYPVALCGTVMCRVDARKQSVKPGDLIVSSDTPGCGMAGKIDSFEKTGTVVGKALDGLSDGIALIPVFVTR